MSYSRVFYVYEGGDEQQVFDRPSFVTIVEKASLS